MKTRFLTAILILLASLGSHTLFAADSARNSKTQFQAGMDYAGISGELLKQVTAGVHNAELYNQLGLSYYHLGQTGRATISFLRALRIDSANKAARNNLEFSISHSPDRELYPEPSFLSAFFSRAFQAINLNLLAISLLLLLLLTSFIVHRLLHLPFSSEKAVTVMWSLLCGLLLISFALLLTLKYQGYRDEKQAVVIISEVNGHSGPGTEYAKIFTLHDGLILQITRSDHNWSLVTLPNGTAGWIPAASLGKVKW